MAESMLPFALELLQVCRLSRRVGRVWRLPTMNAALGHMTLVLFRTRRPQPSFNLLHSSWRRVRKSTSVIQEFLPSIHASRLMRSQQAEERVHPTAYPIVVIVSVSFPRKRGSRRPASSTRLVAVRRARSRISIRRLAWTCPSQSASQAVQA